MQTVTSFSKTIVLVVSIFCVLQLSAQVAEKAEDICPILIGEKIPNATLSSGTGTKVDLLAITTQKPSILVFYRGGWCPFCTEHLSELAVIQKEILNLGYQIIAISPDYFSNLKVTESEYQLDYTVLSDPGGKLIASMGIGFKTSTKTKDYLLSNKENVEVSDVMPVPSVFVIGKDGTVLFEYIKPNFKERMNGSLLLAVLNALQVK
jgi:peroxiredoxin